MNLEMAPLEWDELLRQGRYREILQSDAAKRYFSHLSKATPSKDWASGILKYLDSELHKTSSALTPDEIFHLAFASFNSFLQTNITGPPLTFNPSSIFFQQSENPRSTRQQLISSLTRDGEAAYELIPFAELFIYPLVVFNWKKAPADLQWQQARLRVNFMHQRLLSGHSNTLRDLINEDLKSVGEGLLDIGQYDSDRRAEFLLERASIHEYYGEDSHARVSLDLATQERKFNYALTGRLGKRTKFQQTDISQLVVLAISTPDEDRGEVDKSASDNSQLKAPEAPKKLDTVQPTKLDLNDDTLLESISFNTVPQKDNPVASQEEAIPEVLKSIDPSDQPRLDPLDSIILLGVASSTTNTSPADGLTREETLPYVTRVLEGGSSNWQIYTQALLLRSRIEGYKSRTVERSVLQLQALVDQVIAETTGKEGNGPTTFLPQAGSADSAPVTERLQYIYQLGSPTRWDLESQLAARWLSLGALKTALEIYERLEMWAEVALCWAAIDQEDKAISIVRRLLFHKSSASEQGEATEKWQGPERVPLPPAAPRLFCILGVLTQDQDYYERAWTISGSHYARAQRSLGRLYMAAHDLQLAAEAYRKSLHINRLDRQTWFALGCVYLELAEWDDAASSFARCVQIDDSDAEAWTNLASSLLKRTSTDASKKKIDALRALKRAAELKRDDYRIIANLLVVAVSASPPDYMLVIQAQLRIIDLRGAAEGEKCIDEEIMERLVRHVITSSTASNDDGEARPRPGIERITTRLFEEKIIPLITTSARLWKLVAKLKTWLGLRLEAVEAQEKAWRAVITPVEWETTREEGMWNDVVDATLDLIDGYETFEVGGWKFKSRSAIRGIRSRGKECWEDTEGWTRLTERLNGL